MILKFKERLAHLQSTEKNSGFSFIELVIVVAVIGILTAIAIPAYGAIQATARENTVAATAQQAYSVAMSKFAQGGLDGDAYNAITELSTDTIDVSASGTTEETFKVTARWVADPEAEGNFATRGFESQNHIPWVPRGGEIIIS